MIEALIDPWPPFTFCRPQAIVDQDAGVSIPNSSPFSRSTRFPFTSTPSPPASLAIRKAPSASVESIEPRPPRPREVGRPKGRRRKSRRQSHKFFLAPAAPDAQCRAADRPVGFWQRASFAFGWLRTNFVKLLLFAGMIWVFVLIAPFLWLIVSLFAPRRSRITV